MVWRAGLGKAHYTMPPPHDQCACDFPPPRAIPSKLSHQAVAELKQIALDFKNTFLGVKKVKLFFSLKVLNFILNLVLLILDPMRGFREKIENLRLFKQSNEPCPHPTLLVLSSKSSYSFLFLIQNSRE